MIAWGTISMRLFGLGESAKKEIILNLRPKEDK